MDDIVLVTLDSVRRDFADTFDALSRGTVHTGVTGSHYTRPSLASLLSSNVEAAITTSPRSPTLPEVLSDAGYTCLGYSPTPQTDERFGFDAGFDDYRTFVEPGREGSSLRQYLSQFDPLRKLYYLFKSPQAKSENRPSDRHVVETAVEAFNAAESPRFLWIHMMGTHRPYGQGDDAISRSLDQKAYFRADSLSEEERERILSAYRDSIRRAEDDVSHLLSEIDADPVFALTADHGEAFGEDGFYFHKGHKRSVAPYLTEVPVIVDGIDVSGPMSLLDLAPTLASAVGVDAPSEWFGTNLLEEESDYALTVAPWHDKATVAWQDYETKVVARDADVDLQADGRRSQVERADVDADLEAQLRDLGYMDAG